MTMSETTQRLQLPYMMPAQAMKHVTHNEGLQRIDAALHLSIDLTSANPPEIPSEGLTCWISASPSGDWTGQTGMIAYWQDGAWQFLSPREGWIVWFKVEEHFQFYQDGSWHDMPLPDDGQFDRLGIGATADATNRFALSSDAALLNHGPSGSQQLKINKQTSGNTASLLFQSAWTGHAEMGLAGDNGFSIKQSPDGSNWYSALVVAGNGVTSFPTRPLVKASHTASTVSATGTSRSGFSTLTLSQGGIALGNVISGTMKELTVPSSGNYLAILNLVVASATTGHGAFIAVNSAQQGSAIEVPPSTTLHSHSMVTLLQLHASDKISIGHIGSSEVSFGPGKTELTLLHIG
jgi:hypothetical protein